MSTVTVPPRIPLGPGPVIISTYKITWTNDTDATFPLKSYSVIPKAEVDVNVKPGDLEGQSLTSLGWDVTGDTGLKFPGTTGTTHYSFPEFLGHPTTIGVRIVVDPFEGVPPVGIELAHFEYETEGGKGDWINPSTGALNPATFDVASNVLPPTKITITPSKTAQGGYQLLVNVSTGPELAEGSS